MLNDNECNMRVGDLNDLPDHDTMLFGTVGASGDT
jgi:hypothetical protein